MNEIPILMTYEFWANSPFSKARHTGGMRINGHDYQLVSEQSNRYAPDLMRSDWKQVYAKLGRERTIGLIKNGTTSKVAKEMIKVNVKL